MQAYACSVYRLLSSHSTFVWLCCHVSSFLLLTPSPRKNCAERMIYRKYAQNIRALHAAIYAVVVLRACITDGRQ